MVETLEYKLKTSYEKEKIEVPKIVDQTTNDLIILAIADDSEKLIKKPYTGNPGLLSVLLKYRNQEIPFNLAYDLVAMNVAEQIATKDEAYKSLLPKIIEKHIELVDFYERNPD